jgi:hypothetical protein
VNSPGLARPGAQEWGFPGRPRLSAASRGPFPGRSQARRPARFGLWEGPAGGGNQNFPKNPTISMMSGGEGGIRTPDTVARIPHFECGAIDHSATSPWSQGQTARSVGRYVSNAAGRNKGRRHGAPYRSVNGSRRPGPAVLASSQLGRASIREERCDLAGCRRCQAAGFAPEMRDGVRASCAGSRLSFRSRKCARCTRPGHEISAPARSRRASL